MAPQKWREFSLADIPRDAAGFINPNAWVEELWREARDEGCYIRFVLDPDRDRRRPSSRYDTGLPNYRIATYRTIELADEVVIRFRGYEHVLKDRDSGRIGDRIRLVP